MSKVRSIVVHTSNSNENAATIAGHVNEFHAKIIHSRLEKSNLSPEEQAAVINLILANLRSREIGGIIE